MNSQVLEEKEAARFLGLSVQTLRNWRHQRKGPPYLKISRSVRYRECGPAGYLESKRIDPEAS